VALLNKSLYKIYTAYRYLIIFGDKKFGNEKYEANLIK